MKRLPIVCLLFAAPLFAEFDSSAPKVEEVSEGSYGFLPLAWPLPLGMTPENRERWVTGPDALKEGALRNVKIDELRSFPFFYLFAALFSAVVIFAGRALVERKKRASKSLKHLKLLRIQAYGQLQQIEKMELKDQHDYDVGYTALSAVVRQMLEKRWQLHAPTLTTPEFIERASTLPNMDNSLRDALTHFLVSADNVKFAGDMPAYEQWQEALKTAKSVLDALFRGEGRPL